MLPGNRASTARASASVPNSAKTHAPEPVMRRIAVLRKPFQVPRLSRIRAVATG